MRDPRASAWFRMRHVLPRRLRERVFEPAYYDLFADSAIQNTPRPTLGLRVVWTTVECLGIGISSVLIHRRRPTRATWLILGFIIVATLFVLIRPNYEAT